MTTETAKKQNSNAVRIGKDKLERAGRVARKVAASEDRAVSVSSLVDELLEEGLAKRERKLGIV
jgi:hypothetical protein